MTFPSRSIIAGAFCLLVMLCAVFPPRHYGMDTIEARPSRGFLFSSDLYAERISQGGSVGVTSTRIDLGCLLAEVLSLGGIAGIALIVVSERKPRA
jgi:hypothetical protein